MHNCTLRELSNAFIDNCMAVSNSAFWWYEEDEYQMYKSYLLYGK